MPARVTIQSGISAGTTHWIERPVVRIGNDPKSDICLPSADVAAHALTLEFRDGQYRIYNRSRNDVFVGICVVAPGQAAAWFDTDILQLNKEIALVLDVDDDPTPMPVRRAGGQIDDDGAYDSELEEADDDLAPMAANQSGVGETKSDGSKFLVQLAVTVLCFAGCVGLLVRESMKGDMDGVHRKAPSSGNSSVRDPAYAQHQQNASDELLFSCHRPNLRCPASQDDHSSWPSRYSTKSSIASSDSRESLNSGSCRSSRSSRNETKR